MQPHDTTATNLVKCVCRGCAQPFFITVLRFARGSGKYCSLRCYYSHHPYRPLADRFWAKVDRTTTPDGCWPWTGSHNKAGYGIIMRGGKGGGRSIHSSHAAYELQVGPLPEGHDVLHHCDNPPCVRGSHLFTGTDIDNIRDMMAKGRNVSLPGEANGYAKLTDAEVLLIRQQRLKGILLKDVARTFNVSMATISLIARRERWTHLS